MIIGIDASRNRSGGAKAYLNGILKNLEPSQYDIHEIHIWSYKQILAELPKHPRIIYHSPWQLNCSLPFQLLWQMLVLNLELKKYKCNVLFTTDASTLCRFKPHIVMSQDMLSYEPGIINIYGFTLSRIRLLIILYLQNYVFRWADTVIFLTEYASKIIRSKCPGIKSHVLIPHGINFSEYCNSINSFPTDNSAIECIYISSSDLYKNHPTVILAIEKLRLDGFNCNLTLVGGGTGAGKKKLYKTIEKAKGLIGHLYCFGFLSPNEVSQKLKRSHLFIFASSCENMPITLLEGMASGLPIACSDRGPMPEVLRNGGVYFNPEDYISISKAIKKIIIDGELRQKIVESAKNSALKYSWENCQKSTWSFISNFIKNNDDKLSNLH